MLMHCALLLSQYVVLRVLTMILSLILILILILIRILILWIMILMQHVSCILESFWNHVLYISCFDDVCAFLILHQNEPCVMSN